MGKLDLWLDFYVRTILLVSAPLFSLPLLGVSVAKLKLARKRYIPSDRRFYIIQQWASECVTQRNGAHTHTSSMLFIIILCRKHQFYSLFRRTVNVCVRRTSDGPQSDADHSHTNRNELQKINYVEMVDTVLRAAAAAAVASVATATYSKCLFMLPFKILQVV